MGKGAEAHSLAFTKNRKSICSKVRLHITSGTDFPKAVQPSQSQWTSKHKDSKFWGREETGLYPELLICYLKCPVFNNSKWGMLLFAVLVARSCPTLCKPMEYSMSGLSVHGISQATILEWLAISFSKGSSQPRDQTGVSCIAGRLFTIWTTREVLCLVWYLAIFLAFTHIGCLWKPQS